MRRVGYFCLVSKLLNGLWRLVSHTLLCLPGSTCCLEREPRVCGSRNCSTFSAPDRLRGYPCVAGRWLAVSCRSTLRSVYSPSLHFSALYTGMFEVTPAEHMVVQQKSLQSPEGSVGRKSASSGGRIRTDDLEVMSLASYRAAPPRAIVILLEF